MVYFTWQFSQSKSMILDLLHVDFVSIGWNGYILFTYVNHLKSVPVSTNKAYKTNNILLSWWCLIPKVAYTLMKIGELGG